MCSKIKTMYSADIKKEKEGVYSFRKSVSDKVEVDFNIQQEESQSFAYIVKGNLFCAFDLITTKQFFDKFNHYTKEYQKVNRIKTSFVDENHLDFELYGESINVVTKAASLRDVRYIVATVINEVAKCL